MSSSPARNRRADARRSRAAILDAAVRLLGAQPNAGMDAIATAAGVTRQTVYAHFPSRDRLLTAVLDHLTDETVAAMQAAGPDDGPAAEALLRLLDAADRAAGRHPALLRTLGSLPVTPQADHDRHTMIAGLLERVIRRGQEAGEFDAGASAQWLVTVTIRLAHAAGEETTSGRMPAPESRKALHSTLLRALGHISPP